MMLIPVKFGARWNLCSSSLMAWIRGIGFWGSEGPPVTRRRNGNSEIRTCFRGEEHSDQHVGGGRIPEPEPEGSSSEEVEPGSSWPRCRCFFPAIRPSQWRCLMWKTGSAENRDSWADQGRVRRFLPIAASLKMVSIWTFLRKKIEQEMWDWKVHLSVFCKTFSSYVT